MIKKQNQMIRIKFQGNQMIVNAAVVINIKKLVVTIVVVILIATLVIASIQEELRKYLLELLLGAVQSALMNYISRK